MHERSSAGGTRNAFTLVELLVVIGIIALLVGLLMPALNAARRQAQTTRDLAALRSLMIAFHTYAADNRGKVIPGYWAGPAADDNGDEIHFPANARYPWRLMPYLNKQVRGGILSGEQELLLGDRDNADPDMWAYMVSVLPSFGMNIRGVGGDLVNGLTGHVSKLGEPVNSTELIVFASARYNASGSSEGYYEVRQPAATAVFDKTAPAGDYGFIHPRYKDHAAAGFFDGHASLIDQNELKFSRHWTNTRSYTIVAQ